MYNLAVFAFNVLLKAFCHYTFTSSKITFLKLPQKRILKISLNLKINPTFLLEVLVISKHLQITKSLFVKLE